MKRKLLSALRQVAWRSCAIGSGLATMCAAVAGCDEHKPSPHVSVEHATPARSTIEIQNPNTIHFTDITSGSGIDFAMTCGKTPSSEILEVNGGGLALIDFDHDGDLDLFIANGATLDDPEHGPGCKLYENLGGMKFRDVTERAKINVHRWAMGATVADYDGDGFDDIFICCYGPNILLRNNHDGTFSDVTDHAFAQIAPTHSQFPNWSTSAAFGDFDGDGDLDLYVCNYLDFDVQHRPPHAQYKGVEVMAGPHGLPPQRDHIYENQGDGTFRDISDVSGCAAVSPAFGLNLVVVDFDRDGRQDIAVANDSMPDFLFHNIGPVDGHARFEEIGVISGMASNADGVNQASMGYAIADVNGDGLPDKFTTVFSSDTNSLHVNETNVNQAMGDGSGQSSPAPSSPSGAISRSPKGMYFEDRSQQYGLAMISRSYLGWSSGFYDFDHDGDEDLFMVNGHVYPQATRESMDSEYEQPAMLFERKGNRFARVAPETAGSWLAEKHRGRNAVFADLDNDGDIDIITADLNGPVRVLRNELINEPQPQNSTANWLIVELNDARANSMNRHGLGSSVELIVQDGKGERKQTRWFISGGGYQSSGAPYVHFGLGRLAPDAHIALNLVWPDGAQQRIDQIKPNQHLLIERKN